MSQLCAATIFEAKIALWEVIHGGTFLRCALPEGMERVVFSGEFASRAIQRQGVSYSDDYHESEVYGIDLEFPLLVDGGQRVLPVNTRNREYVLVVLWKDDRCAGWFKRTYRKVRIAPVREDGDAGARKPLGCSMRLRAAILDPEIYGTGAAPALTVPLVSGLLKYRSADGFTSDIYSYGEGLFTRVSEGYVELDVSTPGVIEISVNGELALSAAPGEVSVKSLVGTGATYGAGDVVEFWFDGRRLASLSEDGVFYAPAFTNAAFSGNVMGIGNGSSYFTLGIGGCSCAAFNDEL
jgi:hypothetical protein